MPTPSLAPGRWLLDPAHSTVAIAHKTMWGMVTVNGTFTARAGHGEVREDGTASGTLGRRSSTSPSWFWKPPAICISKRRSP